MTPGIKSLIHKPIPPAVTYDWYCQAYKCKMLKATCELRQQLAKHNGTNQYRAQYSDTCGNCSQIKKGVKMFTEEIETITVNENETTRTCRNCKELLPMDAFTKNKECINGREQTCRKCRAERKKLSEVFRKSEARREKDRPSKGLPMLPKIKHTEPPRLPVGLPPGVTIKPPVPDITDDDMSIDVDFTRYPELMTSVIDVASREFRTPQMQILYMLSKFNDKTGD